LQAAETAIDTGMDRRFQTARKGRFSVPEVVLADPPSAGRSQFVLEAVPGTFAFGVSHPFGEDSERMGHPAFVLEAALDPFPLSQLRG
jgi:hypothetical protein